MTAKEKLDSMDAIGYIKKFNISKADTLILSHYYKNIESKLSILTRGKYLRENIIPITKTYGISNWDRAKLGVFLIKSVLITDENFDKLLKSDKKELEKQLMLEKNKTTSSNKPSKTKTTSPKSVNTNKPSSPKFYSCDEVDIIVKHPKSMEDVRVYDLSGSRVYKISKTMSDKSFKNKSYLGRKKFKSGTIRWVEINPDDVESRLSDNEFIKLHSLEKSSSKTNSGNKNSQTQKREKRIKLRTVLSNQQINKILDKLYKKYKNTDFVLSRDEVLQLGKKKSIWGNEVFNMYVSLAKTYPTLYGKENFVFAIDEGIFFHKGYPVIEYLQKDNSNVFSNPSLKTLNIKEIGNKITIKTAKQTILENVKNSKSRKLILELFEEFDKEFKISEEEKIAEFNFLTEKFIGNYNIIEHKVTYKLFKNRILWIETPIYDSKKRSTSVKEFPIENINDLKLGLLTLGGLYKPQLSLDRVLHNLSEEQLIEAKKIMTTINLIAQNNKKSSAEIKSIIDKVASRKVTIVENFVNEFDKNNNGKLDLLESNIFSDVLNKNQKLIIDKNPDYVHKFIKLSKHIKSKSQNLQLFFERTQEFISENDELLIQESVDEIDFFKGLVNSYNLTVFHAINMVASFVEDDLFVFYEIYETFDGLNVFNSNWENDVAGKLSNIEDKLDTIISSIRMMEARIVNKLDQLQNSMENSFESLERSVNKQLETTNSMLGFNNLLTAVQTYQMYKINKNTKSIRP